MSDSKKIIYLKVPMTRQIAREILGEKVQYEFEREPEITQKIKKGESLYSKEYEVFLDIDGAIIRGGFILKAISRISEKEEVDVLVHLKTQDTVFKMYPEIERAIKAKCPKKIVDFAALKITEPFRTVISPYSASLLLLHNLANRPTYSEHAEGFRLKIEKGLWHGNNACMITLDQRGIMSNGQHRLIGCILANKDMEDMVLCGNVEQNADIDVCKPRTAKQNFQIQYGYPPKGMDVTNLIFRMLTREHITPPSDLAIEMYLLYEDLFADVPEIFHTTSKAIKVDAPYRTAMLILLENGEFSKEEIIKIHKSLNENEAVSMGLDKELRNLQTRMKDFKKEFTGRSSSASNQITKVYALLGNLVPLLRGEKRTWTYLPDKASAVKIKEKLDAFIEEAVGKTVKELIAR